MTENSLKIRARDGYVLSARVFGEQQTGGTVFIMASATGVSQGFYGSFCQWLARDGRIAISFDYRGIGDSLDGSIKDCKADIHTWGAQDLAGVIDYCQTTWQPRSLYLVGHSVGGQITGVTPNADQLDGLFLVAAISAYWRHWRGLGLLKIWAAWHFLFPVVSKILGYFPGKLYGGEDLPAGVARQWARWGRNRDYILSYGPEVARGFSKIEAPMALYSFSDDEMATKPAADSLFTWYTHSREKLHRHLKPDDVGMSSIGHFSFFRKKSADILWPEVIKWLEEHRQV